MRFKISMLVVLLAVVVIGLALTFQRPEIKTVQRGYRGTAMAQIINDSDAAAKQYANQLPEPIPTLDPVGQKASEVYTNVKVLGDVDAADFIRLMNAMTKWVAPQQGCSYCHDLNDLASDKLYTKIVARRMIQMVRHVNSDWKTHVAMTGVTCYTCHRGQPVPANIWFTDPGPETASGALGTKAGQNAPLRSPGLSSLPFDPFTPFLNQGDDIRVVSLTALPDGDHKSIKQTEWTYALMMHMSTALGVNCTYCHNTRSFMDWSQSTPQRVTAWYGIRMVRDLNMHYLDPLASTFPPIRHGPTGDGPKLNCATCHQGVYKPLFGASMLKDFPVLATEASAAALAPASPAPPPAAPAPPPAAAPAPAPAAPAAPAPSPAPK